MVLNINGSSYTVELSLGSYNSCRRLLDEISVLRTDLAAATTDADRIVIMTDIMDIQNQMLQAFLVERL